MASVSLLFVEYVRTVNRYNKEYASDLEVIEKTVVPPLADSMWSFDVEQSRLLVSGLMHFDSVVSVEIIDSEKESLCSDAKDGIPLHPDSVPVVFYLTVNRGNEKAEVGELIIYQLDIRQNNEVIESFVFNFLNDFILIFIFLLILLLIITRRITRPLVLLANQIMKTRSGAHLSDSFSIPSKKQKYLSEIQEIETSFLTSFRRMDSEIKARKESEKSLTESLKEKKVLLREVHHRVKNNLQIIIGLLNLQQSSISDEKAKEVLSESQHRIYSMAMVHELIYQTDELSTIYLQRYLSQLGAYLVDSFQNDGHIQFEVRRNGEEPEVNIETAIPCGLIVNELITNACKHAFVGKSGGVITLRIKYEGGRIGIVVEDDGVGFSMEFGDNSLENFESIGLKIIHNLCLQLNADCSCENKGTGTRFSFEFAAGT